MLSGTDTTIMGLVSIGASMRTTSVELLEREPQLEVLRRALADASEGRGRLLFVSGEAGVGKTSLLRHFAYGSVDGTTRVLSGACDSLFTPRVLGPLLDVAQVVGGELAETVLAGARPHEVHRALAAELERHSPTILILEDVHWADEATLDVIRLLGRRLEGTATLVLASYRSDELDWAHPLRLVLGELAMVRSTGRLEIQALSPAAVAVLAEPYGVDPEELFRTTAGNPFFVTEVLAAGSGAPVPGTVRDAVLARVARLSPRRRRSWKPRPWSRHGPSSGCSRSSRETRGSSRSTSAFPPAFSRRTAESSSGTSWRSRTIGSRASRETGTYLA